MLINSRLIGNTGALITAQGTTAQRPSNPLNGSLRYNSTTGFAEVYTASGWGIFGALPPSISSVSPTTFNGEQGTTFTVNGQNFTSDAIVKFVTNSNTEYIAATVSFINSTQLLATTPKDFTVAEEPLDVKVSQASGTVTALDSIDCGGTPAWSTAAGNLATYYYPIDTSYNLSVFATDPDTSSTITYSVSSGSLPGGANLNTTTGSITGTITDPGSSTVTSNFDINATDNAGNISTRSFNIIRNWADGSTSVKAATSAKAIYNLSASFRGTSANGIYWIKPSTPYTGSAVQLYCDMTYDGGGWALIHSYHKGQSPIGDQTSYYTSPQAAATAASLSLAAVATPNDPSRSYSLPVEFWQAFSSNYNSNTGGELREEIAVNGGTWPNNSSRVVLFIGGRTNSGAAGNYLTSSQMITCCLVCGYNGSGTVNNGWLGSICRTGYQSNTMTTESAYSGTNKSTTVLGIQVDKSDANGSRIAGDGTYTYTNTNAASGYSWMGRGNCCGMGAGSANGAEPNGTRWGLIWIR